MKVVILSTINFVAPDLNKISAEQAEQCRNAGLVLGVYQNQNGESQAKVLIADDASTTVEILDAF